MEEHVFRLVATGSDRGRGAIVLHRDRHEWTPPPGWTPCEIDGETLHVKVASQYINKLSARPHDEAPNLLSSILARWFGAKAWTRGNRNFVWMEPSDEGIRIRPHRSRRAPPRKRRPVNLRRLILKLQALTLAGRTTTQREQTVRLHQPDFKRAVLEIFRRQRNGQSCACPGCGHDRPTSEGEPLLEAHHVLGFARTRSMDPRWGVPLCPNCHALMSRGTSLQQAAIYLRLCHEYPPFAKWAASSLPKLPRHQAPPELLEALAMANAKQTTPPAGPKPLRPRPADAHSPPVARSPRSVGPDASTAAGSPRTRGR